jgi:serine/threonine protein kinase
MDAGSIDPLREDVQRALGASYSLNAEIGGGGMSRVFLARDLSLGRDVVVKVLAPELAEGLSAERFVREIKLAASLQEPHIVPVHAAGVTGAGLPYYTMPFVAGQSLRARMATALSINDTVSILRDVAKALDYAHGRGVVHRDIKPENILLSNGTAVVTDFGIAKALRASKTHAPGGALTSVGMSVGTPAYMAPEQAAGDEVDHRADIYAWGVMAYELLAGRHPFGENKTAQQLIAAHIAAAPAPLATVAPGVPAALAALVMEALSKNPEHRPESAAMLIGSLDDMRTTGSQEQPASRRWVVGGVAAAALILVGVALVTWLPRREPSPLASSPAAPLMLAVLPFEHAGPPDEALFTDGLTDAVTAKLGALPGLGVIERRSAAQYKATTKPAKQIGRELGVAYLVEGVVRWAKAGNGSWRAQVTPTLVDATTGTTKWTGAPEVITPTDPFSAQGAIATKVADALAVELRPSDRAGLARRMTDNPDAFAAYLRGRALMDLTDRSGSGAQYRRIYDEYARAIALDSSFANAWGELANTSYLIAIASPADSVARARMRADFAAAQRHAPDQPRLLLGQSLVKAVFDRDTTNTGALIRRAIAGAPNDAAVLRSAGGQLFNMYGQLDTGYALVRRAAMIDPRAGNSLSRASDLAVRLRRWDDARRFANALVALDSTDPRGWGDLLHVSAAMGDTLAMQHDLVAAFARLTNPGRAVLEYMVSAGGVWPARFASLGPTALGVQTWADSSYYFYHKATAFAVLGDAARRDAYLDSLRQQNDRPLVSITPLSEAALALAQAWRGQGDAARRTLARLAAKSNVSASYVPESAPVEAAVHARLGEPDEAVRWLEKSLADPAGGTTLRGLLVSFAPWLAPLRGTPAFDRFLRQHAR